MSSIDLNLLRNLIEALDEGFVIFDTNMTMVLCNERYKKLYAPIGTNWEPGVGLEQIARDTAFHCVGIKNPAEIDAWVENRLSSYKQGGKTFEHQLLDGRWLRGSETILANGWSVGTRTDITTSKLREHELREKQIQLETIIGELRLNEIELNHARDEAEENNRLKTEFLANMSHEIRTPLNGILGMAQVLEQTQFDERQQQFLATIRASGDALRAIVDDVLDISKIEAGLLDLVCDEFDIHQLTKQAIDAVSGVAIEKGLSIEAEVKIAQPAFYKADTKRIRQVLINLLGNAVKFSTHGPINVDVSLTSNGMLRFAVQDRGPGITADKQKTIFERFRQADGSATRKHGGTGLGLAISRHLIEMMEGEIGLNSTPGTGSEFWFTIPAQPVEALQDANINALRSVAMQSKTTPGSKPLRVLLAEDNIVNQSIIAEFLTATDSFTVDIAGNGAEALSKLEHHAYHLVLMDIQMPVMNGEDAIRHIRRSKHPYSDVPIIAVSADAIDGSRDKYVLAGATDYIAKPIDLHAMLDMILKHSNHALPVAERQYR